MGKVRLTKARRVALEWFRDNDGAKFFPVHIARKTPELLCDEGLLSRFKPPFGYVRYSITPAGRKALAEAGEHNRKALAEGETP